MPAGLTAADFSHLPPEIGLAAGFELAQASASTLGAVPALGLR